MSDDPSDVVACLVYRGARKNDTYLFVAETDRLTRVPGSLLSMLGELEHVMDLPLSPGRKLAQAGAAQVLEQIAEVGYYLQLPPGEYDRRGT